MKVLFVINQASGRGRRYAQLRQSIERRFRRSGHPCEFEVCPSAGAVGAIVDRAVSDGYDTVCAVGGDGTVNTIGSHMVGRDIALAVIPTGSGNGFARHLGIPLSVDRAVDAIASGRVETIDTGIVNELTFLMISGIGLDAVVAHRFAERAARGMRTYLRAATASWFRYVPDRYQITVDGTSFERESLLIAVANSSQYGNRARIAPLASLRDGLLDVTLVHRLRLHEAPVVLGRLFSGRLRPTRDIEMIQVPNLTVERVTEGVGHVDGEPLWMPRKIEFRVRPASLRVVVPRGAKAL